MPDETDVLKAVEFEKEEPKLVDPSTLPGRVNLKTEK